ncbi:caspase family protein [Rubrivivax gelatinosus]|uniref:Peptidase C14 caspase domain-containing protein n=1 Tax=Rubrivivax gelatinosus TaxID=28068 RepID=A0ABS1DXI4_RUBGE|nr:caspase family protein [Rubrivivax gelatinosus]MBK1714355.1 hypothetical protein [Rubrivivax gelatinosus]
MANKALVVGINNYAGSNALSCCVNDAKAVAALLKTKLGFNSGDVTELHDEAATKARVKSGLQRLLQGATRDDRLLFFFSGHGYRKEYGQELRDTLVMQDHTFLDEQELRDAMVGVPHGTFTILLDACFSGGAEKFFLDEDGRIVDLGGRPKTWVPDTKDFNDTYAGRRVVGLVHRPFGGAASRDDGKGYVPGAGALVLPLKLEESRALLLAACKDDETARDGNQKTNYKSVFTYALMNQIDTLGASSSTLDLANGAANLLTDMGHPQTPTLKTPIAPNGLETRPFVVFNGGSKGLAPEIDPKGWLDVALQLGGVIAPAVVSALPTIVGAVQGRPAVAAGAAKGQGFGQDDSKGWQDIASVIVEKVVPFAIKLVPAVLQAVQQASAADEPGRKNLAVELDQKDWADLATNIGAAAVPVLLQAVPAFIGAGGSAAATKGLRAGELDQKGWADLAAGIANAVLPVALQLVPQVLDILGGKGTAKAKALDDKGWLDIAAKISAAVVPLIVEVVPDVVRAIQELLPAGSGGHKSLLELDEGSKAWYDTIGAIVSQAASIAVPLLPLVLTLL